MPGAAQLALLDVLRGTVRVAEDFNGGYRGAPPGGAGSEARLAAAAALAAGAAAAAAGGGGPQPQRAGGRGVSAEGSWEVVERPGQQAPPPPQQQRRGAAAPAAAPSGELGTPGGGGGKGGAAEGLLPALARQEVLGGCLLIGALQRCSEQPLSSVGRAGLAGWLAWQAESFCDIYIYLRSRDGDCTESRGTSAAAAVECCVRGQQQSTHGMPQPPGLSWPPVMHGASCPACPPANVARVRPRNSSLNFQNF